MSTDRRASDSSICVDPCPSVAKTLPHLRFLRSLLFNQRSNIRPICQQERAVSAGLLNRRKQSQQRRLRVCVWSHRYPRICTDRRASDSSICVDPCPSVAKTLPHLRFLRSLLFNHRRNIQPIYQQERVLSAGLLNRRKQSQQRRLRVCVWGHRYARMSTDRRASDSSICEDPCPSVAKTLPTSASFVPSCSINGATSNPSASKNGWLKQDS